MSFSIAISNNSRAAQSSMIVAIGALVAAATSIYIIHCRRRKWSEEEKGEEKLQSDKDTSIISPANDERSIFHKQLGISEENLPSHIQREIHKERQRKAKVELISMKTPMYDNVFMLDQNREPMCTISMKKARWYIKKGIAEWSSFEDGEQQGSSVGTFHSDNNKQEGKCIRLLFEHNGTSGGDDKESSETLYLRSAKQNICVACGDDGHHIRHYIVPYSYRALLPHEYKSHMSHDIVIMCPDCHVDCERVTKRRMKQMENETRMQMGGDAYNTSPMIEDPHLHHIRGCAIALVKWKESMPTEKVERYEKDVREYLASCLSNDEEERDAILNGNEELTKSQLQKACSVNYRARNPNFIPGSEVVVRSLKGAKDIEEFIIEWRQHFLSTVNPQHMPKGWSVDNPVVCGRDKDDHEDGLKTW
ncbi:hypothetical protein ACHAXR_003085 [Thalassiosira sp. AJA248-18]